MVEATDDQAMSDGVRDPTPESIKKVPYVSRGRDEPTKADMLKYLTCYLCKGVYRDAHTINECMCTFCKGCVYSFFFENAARNRCPNCKTELGGKPLETIVRDITLQNIVDWLIPDFKERDDKFKSILLLDANTRRVAKGKLKPEVLIKKKQQNLDTNDSTEPKVNSDIEFKLLPFPDEDTFLKMGELPKKLKIASRSKTVLTVKKHINNLLEEPIDNIEVMCKNIPVPDSHTLEFVKRTKWQHTSRAVVLMYRRKKRIIGN